MRRLLVAGFAALSLFGATAAHASPGHAQLASASEPYASSSTAMSLSTVDLALRPSILAATRGVDGVDLQPAPAEVATRGTYMGPVFVEGIYAKHIAHLPSQMRRGMARAVGPCPLILDRNKSPGTGGGAGLYARFD